MIVLLKWDNINTSETSMLVTELLCLFHDDLGEKVEEIKERVKREKEMAQKIKKI